MELKCSLSHKRKDIILGFNRTFMELKFDIGYFAIYVCVCFNRTFMELKYPIIDLFLQVLRVLIVPLWN